MSISWTRVGPWLPFMKVQLSLLLLLLLLMMMMLTMPPFAVRWVLLTATFSTPAKARARLTCRNCRNGCSRSRDLGRRCRRWASPDTLLQDVQTRLPLYLQAPTQVQTLNPKP